MIDVGIRTAFVSHYPGPVHLSRVATDTRAGVTSGRVHPACAPVGQIDEALNAVDEVLPFAQTEGRYYEAELNRLRGELLLKQDASNAAQAEQSFRTAIEIVRSQSAKS